MKKTLVLTLTIFSTACAQYGGYHPTIDAHNDRNAYRLDQDMAECRGLAEQSSGGAGRETAIGAGVGSLVGAAGGAIVGAFTGNPGAGAAIGAAAGGFGGGGKQAYESDQRYRYAYNNCLQNRGHNVIR